MKEFFYLDRPAVPATQQALIDIDAIVDVGVDGSFDDIITNFEFTAAEVKDVEGKIDGTLLYVPGVSFEELTKPTDVEIGIAESDEYLTSKIEDEVEDKAEDKSLEDYDFFDNRDYVHVSQAAWKELREEYDSLSDELADADDEIEILKEDLEAIDAARVNLAKEKEELEHALALSETDVTTLKDALADSRAEVKRLKILLEE